MAKKPYSKTLCQLTSVYAVLVVVLVLLNILPTAVLIMYGVSSLASYVLYALDKQAAINGERRTPEYSLHLWALFGGWLGASFAQHRLRHKTQKEEFQLFFHLSIIANIILMTLLFLVEPYL